MRCMGALWLWLYKMCWYLLLVFNYHLQEVVRYRQNVLDFNYLYLGIVFNLLKVVDSFYLSRICNWSEYAFTLCLLICACMTGCAFVVEMSDYA